MSKDRFNGFIDAIVAIILTIMILDIKPPTINTLSGLWALVEPLMAYFNTFIIIWISWYSHHELMKNLDIITYKIYWLSGLWILLMSLFPIATAWVGEGITELAPNLFYLFISLLNFANYHLLLEPAILNKIPIHLRPKVRNSISLESIRLTIIIASCIIIWFWPPISLVTMLIISALHVTEHLHMWKIAR